MMARALRRIRVAGIPMIGALIVSVMLGLPRAVSLAEGVKHYTVSARVRNLTSIEISGKGAPVVATVASAAGRLHAILAPDNRQVCENYQKRLD